MMSERILSWRFGPSDPDKWERIPLASDQAAMQKIAELHIEALETGQELVTLYNRTTTTEEDPE